MGQAQKEGRMIYTKFLTLPPATRRLDFQCRFNNLTPMRVNLTGFNVEIGRAHV